MSCVSYDIQDQDSLHRIRGVGHTLRSSTVRLCTVLLNCLSVLKATPEENGCNIIDVRENCALSIEQLESAAEQYFNIIGDAAGASYSDMMPKTDDSLNELLHRLAKHLRVYHELLVLKEHAAFWVRNDVSSSSPAALDELDHSRMISEITALLESIPVGRACLVANAAVALTGLRGFTVSLAYDRYHGLD